MYARKLRTIVAQILADMERAQTQEIGETRIVYTLGGTKPENQTKAICINLTDMRFATLAMDADYPVLENVLNSVGLKISLTDAEMVVEAIL